MRAVRLLPRSWLAVLGGFCLAAVHPVGAQTVPDFASTNVEPYVMVILDSSSSMFACATSDGSYSFDCAATSTDPLDNANQRRYAIAVRALLNIVSSYGTQVDWALVTTTDSQAGQTCTGAGACSIRPLPACIGICSKSLTCKVGLKRRKFGDITSMSTALRNYFTAMRTIESVINSLSSFPEKYAEAEKHQKDWDLGFKNATSAKASAYEEWVRTMDTAVDAYAYCRKRATIFVTGGGASTMLECNDTLATSDPSLCCIDQSDQFTEEIYALPSTGSFTDENIETYVMGFNIYPGDFGFIQLERIALAGHTVVPSNANSEAEYNALVTDLLNRILAGTYTGSNPVISPDYKNLYQAYFEIFDPATYPALRAFKGHVYNFVINQDPSSSNYRKPISPPLWDAQTWYLPIDWQSSDALGDRKVFTSFNDTVNADPTAKVYFSAADLANFVTSLDVTYSDVDCDGLTGATNGDAERDEDAAALVAFISGDTTREYSTCNGVYRENYKLLDIYRSTPRYVGPATAQTLDSTYTSFQRCQKYRKEVLAVGSNSGMIHGFTTAYPNPLTGERIANPLPAEEQWAYIPQHLLPRLKVLWQNAHSTMVDSTGSLADIKVRTFTDADSEPDSWPWRTVFVIGDGIKGEDQACADALASGNASQMWQCGYYSAIDISVPNGVLVDGYGCVPETDDNFTIKPMWEFTGDGDLLEAVAPPSFTQIHIDPEVSPATPAARYVVLLAGRGTTLTGVPNTTPCHSPIYVLDPGYGTVIKKLLLPYKDTSSCDPGALHGIFGQPLAIDSNNNLLTDRFLVGDMDGQLFVLNVGSSDAEDWDDTGNVQMAFAADYGDFADHIAAVDANGDHTYTLTGSGVEHMLPITYTPAATFTGDGDILFYVGTGDPTSLDNFSADARGHLYVLLYDVSDGSVEFYPRFNDPPDDGTATPDQTSGYWSFDEGEVLAGETVLVSGTLIFTTYVRSSEICGIGSGRLYALDYLTAEGKFADDGDSDDKPEAYVSLGEGIPSGVVLGNNRVYVTMNDTDSDDFGVKTVDVGEFLEPMLPYSWSEVTGN